MTGTALTNGRVLLDGHFQTGPAVLLEGRTIKGLVSAAEVPADTARVDLGGHMLMPGFIDTQVNGGGGILFNDEPTVEGIAAIGAAHRRFGTTGFLPTLISDDLDKVASALGAVRDAIGAGVPGVLGIHVEGPFLNVERKGIHDAGKIRRIDEEAIELLSSSGLERLMVTLAPEMAPPGTIRRLADAGVIVSAGHTNATAAQMLSAADAGLRGVTHLFNAMTQLGSREPGVVGAALVDERTWCGIIVDGRHVDPITLQIALRAKGKNRLMLVTDGMPSVGSADKDFVLQGRRISVRDGVCLDDAGTLAGSDLDMATAVRNAAEMMRVGLAGAAEMASSSPAAFLGLERELGRIAPGCRANLVLADDALNVRQTWIDGINAPA